MRKMYAMNNGLLKKMPVYFLTWILSGSCNGLQQECKRALGLENGAISDRQMSASTERDTNHAAVQGRLQFKATANPWKAGAWCAEKCDANQWLQIDLDNELTAVTRVATQGRSDYNQWVTRYQLLYSNNGVNFQYYREGTQTTNKEFTGNTDRNTVVYHDLNPPIRARFVRFRPVAWNGWISMRVELYGCQDQCRTLHFTKPTIGKAFVGHLIRSLKVTTESSCKVNCYMEESCASLNLGPVQDGKLMCQLSDSDHHFHPQDLISQAGYIYIATKQNFCLTNTCNPTNTLSCQSGFSERGFLCVCKAGYYGNNCDEASPEVETYPQITSTQEGNNVTFSCKATGLPRPVITWIKSQGSLPASSSVSSEDTLTILNVRLEYSGSYDCNAKNTHGTNFSSVELKVLPLPVSTTKLAFSPSVVKYVGEILRLSCPASLGAVPLWKYNGTTSLPQEALLETPNILFIPSLRKNHAGNFSCFTGNFLLININLSVLYPETCSRVKQNISDVSDNYVIDPDGKQGEAPFIVYCNMTDRGGVGVTAVSHDSEARTHVNGFENPGSYHRDVHYIGCSLSQIKGLTEISECECQGSMLRGLSVNNPKVFAWWVSRDGENMTYWGEASEGCVCGMKRSCSDRHRLCNCDKNDNVWREDSGLLTNKSHLPVSQLRFGDTGASVENGYHSLGKLKCFGMN